MVLSIRQWSLCSRYNLPEFPRTSLFEPYSPHREWASCSRFSTHICGSHIRETTCRRIWSNDYCSKACCIFGAQKLQRDMLVYSSDNCFISGIGRKARLGICGNYPSRWRWDNWRRLISQKHWLLIFNLSTLDLWRQPQHVQFLPGRI